MESIPSYFFLLSILRLQSTHNMYKKGHTHTNIYVCMRTNIHKHQKNRKRHTHKIMYDEYTHTQIRQGKGTHQSFWSGSGVFACFGSRSGSGFQISLDPDPGTQKECRKGSKSDISEEILKFMSKNEKGNNFLLKLIIKQMENF